MVKKLKPSLIGWLYVGMIVAWLLGRLLGLSQRWWFDLLNYPALYLFTPLIILLPLALLSRWRRLAIALLVPLGAFVWLFGGTFVPRPQEPPAPGSQQIKALTLNKLWSNLDRKRIVALIHQEQPDIVGMQEVTPYDMAAFRKALATDYPYDVYFQPDEPGLVRNSALFSRYPIKSALGAQAQRDADIVAELTMHGKPLQVIVTHFVRSNFLNYPRDNFKNFANYAFKLRRNEAETLMQHVAERKAPMLILCDCNMTRTNLTYDMLASVMADSFAEAGWGFGNSVMPGSIPLPLLRIDYMWHSPELSVRSIRVGPDVSSDHLPVIATFDLAP